MKSSPYQTIKKVRGHFVFTLIRLWSSQVPKLRRMLGHPVQKLSIDRSFDREEILIIRGRKRVKNTRLGALEFRVSPLGTFKSLNVHACCRATTETPLFTHSSDITKVNGDKTPKPKRTGR